jgi:uncharacterized protein
VSVPALASFAAALALAAPQSVEVPRNDGWVTDLARVLAPNEERALESLCESYKSGSGGEIAVLTVPELGGVAIERFALEVGREWKIGREGVDGALLVVALKEREVRIEVGSASEGALNDARAGRIVRHVIVPRFREGEYFEGLRDGLSAIHAALGGKYAEVEPAGPHGSGAGSIVAVLFVVLFVVLFLVLVIRTARGRRAVIGHPMGPMGMPHRTRGFGRLGGGFGGLGSSGGGFSGFGGSGRFGGGGATGRW